MDELQKHDAWMGESAQTLRDPLSREEGKIDGKKVSKWKSRGSNASVK